MAARIKKGDMVVVIAGKDKGSSDKPRTGKVMRVLPETEQVLVEGVNRIKRHQKATPRIPQGGIVEKEAPIHLSKVMLLDTKGNKPTRVRIGTDKDGKKVRVAVKSGAVIG